MSRRMASSDGKTRVSWSGHNGVSGTHRETAVGSTGSLFYLRVFSIYKHLSLLRAKRAQHAPPPAPPGHPRQSPLVVHVWAAVVCVIAAFVRDECQGFVFEFSQKWCLFIFGSCVDTPEVCGGEGFGGICGTSGIVGGYRAGGGRAVAPCVRVHGGFLRRLSEKLACFYICNFVLSFVSMLYCILLFVRCAL